MGSNDVGMNIKVDTRIKGSKIEQEISSVHDDVRRTIGRQLMDTQETHIKEALIAMGWTPSEESRTCRNCKFGEPVLNGNRMSCKNPLLSFTYAALTLDRDFGCNKWEPITKEKTDG